MKKKFTKSVIGFFTAFTCAVMIISAFPKKTYAGGISIWTSSDYVAIGESFTVTITLYGSEIYGFQGYVDCDGIFSGETGSFADGANGDSSVSVSYTFQALAEGTGYVYAGDCQVSDGETIDYIGGAACAITVYSNEQGGGGTGGGAGGDDDYNVDGEYVNGNVTKSGSSDCDLSSLKVEGYELKDEGHDAYSLSVNGSVEKIKIVATPHDSKATVKGDGEQKLVVGDNKFEILVTAENGFSKSYVITVTRRGNKVLLKDLINEISTTKEDTVTVELKDGDKLTTEIITAVKKWGKTLILNKYSEDGKLVYGWNFNGKNIGDLKEFDPSVTFESENEEKIDELSNFAKGLIINFAYTGTLPKGTKFSVNISEEFKKNDIVRLYYYDKEKSTMTLESEDITITDDTVSLDVTHCCEYLLTRAKIGAAEVKQTNNKKEIIMVFAIGLELAIIIALVVFIIVRGKKNGGKKNNNTKKENDIDNDQDELKEIDYQDLYK